MNLFSIIKIHFKEQIDQKLFFYYEIDSLKMNKDTSGIIEIYIQVFEDLPRRYSRIHALRNSVIS